MFKKILAVMLAVQIAINPVMAVETKTDAKQERAFCQGELVTTGVLLALSAWTVFYAYVTWRGRLAREAEIEALKAKAERCS